LFFWLAKRGKIKISYDGDYQKKIRRASIIYINKELFEFDNIKNYKDLIAFVEQHKKTGINYTFKSLIYCPANIG